MLLYVHGFHGGRAPASFPFAGCPLQAPAFASHEPAERSCYQKSVSCYGPPFDRSRLRESAPARHGLGGEKGSVNEPGRKNHKQTHGNPERMQETDA